MNNFYASVECLYNPLIRELPVAVCGDADARHGIILAKNGIAKAFGVSTGEAIWQAKQKCPNLHSVSANFSLYLKFSKLARDIYSDYTDMIEPFGIDESWLDVSKSTGLFGSAETIANEIRARVLREMGVSVSIGVSFNKIFAKLGSDMKKPNATTVISRENYKEKIWDLPVSDLLYVGRSTTKTLTKLNVKTIGELANFDTNILRDNLGKMGIVLQDFALGKDTSVVRKKEIASVIKSIGNSQTSHRDLYNLDDVRAMFYMLSESVCARLRSHGLKCKTVQISIRNKDLLSCERQGTLKNPSYLSSEIAEKAIQIFMQKYDFKSPLRSIGVRGTNLVLEDSNIQLDMFSDFERIEKLEKLEHTIDNIRSRFGSKIVQRGIIYTDKQLLGMNPKDDHVIHPVSYF